MKNKVVLLYPAYDGPPLGPPLSLLSLAAPLLDAGFEVSVLDSAIEPDIESALARHIHEAACVGISFLTGSMIRGAVRLAKLARRLRPGVPVVFGGWHSSLLPQQTLESGLADLVVRGQGERTLVEIASAIREGRSTTAIPGTSLRVGAKSVHNPERPTANVNSFPPAAFSLADFDAYERVTGMRKLPYASSLGCPYACHYCTDQVFYERKFNAFSVNRVIAEVTELVSGRRLQEVAFLDSNFPVNVQRAVDIARGFIDSGVRFRWTFQASTDLICRMSDEDMAVLAQSGVAHMGFGTESASEKVLTLMNKKHQRISDMYETARKSEQAGIRATFNLILGYPGETEQDRAETFAVMTDISRKHAHVGFSPNIFTPYPGIPIWPELRTMGVREPQTLEEWANVDLGSNHLPWLQGRDLARLKRRLEYFLLTNQIRRTSQGSALAAPLRWRLKHNQYAIPWELWLSRASRRLVSRRSLLTGQALRHGVSDVC
jgi:radical SAM superfamily enzyme YgiQ (UPF0313 family)